MKGPQGPFLLVIMNHGQRGEDWRHRPTIAVYMRHRSDAQASALRATDHSIFKDERFSVDLLAPKLLCASAHGAIFVMAGENTGARRTRQYQLRGLAPAEASENA
jgi:hypothetical protein